MESRREGGMEFRKVKARKNKECPEKGTEGPDFVSGLERKRWRPESKKRRV